jgi:hypothetical protein
MSPDRNFYCKVSNILSITSSISSLIMITLINNKNYLGNRDVSKIFVILILLQVIYFISNISRYYFNLCPLTTFIRVYSETGMFVWTFFLIYSTFQFICYNQKMRKRNWKVFVSIGTLYPFLIAGLSFMFSIESTTKPDNNNYCDYNDPLLTLPYFIIKCLIETFLYLFGIFFFYKAKSIMHEILPEDHIELKKRYLYIYRFVLIYFLFFLIVIIIRILKIAFKESIFIEDLYSISYLILSTTGIIYFMMFLYTYFFSKDITVLNESEELLNDSGKTGSSNNKII